MVIINPSNATQPAAFNRPAGPAPILPTDKVLNAVVMGQRAEHLYELASGNLRLMAESQTALRRGEQLLLQVTGKDSQQRPTLQVLGGANTAAITPLLKTMIPQQQSINHLLASSAQLSTATAPPQLKAISQAIMDILPLRQQVSDPTGLREAIAQSGFFMENQLAAGTAPPGDLKSALLRMAQRLENLRLSSAAKPAVTTGEHKKLLQDYSELARSSGAKPASAGAELATALLNNSGKPATSLSTSYGQMPKPSDLPGELRAQGRLAAELPDIKIGQEAALKQLLQEARGAIARLESHQLLHLQQKDPQQAQYIIELPVRNDDGVDVWQMQLQWQAARDHPEENEQHKSDESDENLRRWLINLNFDLPGLGPINARVQQQGSTLAITFNSEHSKTHELIAARQHELNLRLEEQGITATEIQSHTGISNAANSPLSNQSLLEDQA
ncbi:flagellar hook-length control protein FliK [Zhongshania guokunii]|uniref:Flagellar hook-length control protein FliK n=1 Tax=Zhongshania guokunii TaxID=641783 RepID=A0ABV3U6K3_9GAMM